jgi:hypothetical protein
MSLVDALYDVIDEQRKLLDSKPQNYKPVMLAYAPLYLTFKHYQEKMPNVNLVFVNSREKLMGQQRGLPVLFLGTIYDTEFNEQMRQTAMSRGMPVLNVTEIN